MLFNSSQFIYFFTFVVGLYFFLPYAWRWSFLLLMSCLFYMAFVPKYILILFFTIVIDYFAGIYIESSAGRKRQLFLTVSIVANLGILAFFKYFDFFALNLNAIATFLHWNYSIGLLGMVLPIGLSFHTFQAMSYTIEVYRGNQKAERHLGIYALYVMFFPQLVAGPIERPQNLLHQFYENHDFNYDRVTRGLKLMAWGFFKKIVIADRLALLVNTVFSDPSSVSGPVIFLTLGFFTYQIYCDFSGYSDIARGTALVLGFRLMDNFNRPLASTSIAEFWRKWHISLSSWLRDYLYYPLALGWGRVSKIKMYISSITTFVIIGFWHGANWTFVVFGALHGVYLVFATITEKYRSSFASMVGMTKFPKLQHYIQVAEVFFLASFANAFFRASSVKEALFLLSAIPHNFSTIFTLSFWHHLPSAFKVSPATLVLSSALIVFLELVQLWYKDVAFEEKLSSASIRVRWSLYYVLILAVLFLYVKEGQQFIYFQF